MIEKNLQFSIKDEYGKDINCFIFAYKPVNSTEINILFNQSDDPDDTLRYGKLVKNGNHYTLFKNLTSFELEELKKLFHEEVKAFCTNIISSSQEEL